jgi:hypothetical protein
LQSVVNTLDTAARGLLNFFKTENDADGEP